jgi:NADPH-dependent 7-cyano-7-deazaguanine reductase QueF
MINKIKGEIEMKEIKKYIIIFDREYSLHDDIILSIKQDINRSNNPTDDKIIRDYIYYNYGTTPYDVEELDSLEEISI